ncbi:MAG: alkaline phosphatase family protein [Candidatus Jettenia sp.]|nr:MAG: alkaline phosphatase family protein [Candidatus Jettenia sp.]
MAKVMVIGIDGLDPDLIHTWQSELPSFRKIMNEGYAGKIESVFPPDSVSAWATIFTGKTPAQHGIMEHVSYLDNGSTHINISNMIGKTFWDFAGKAGKKVCVVNPFLAYPVWPVNGVMISGPVFMKGDVQSYPSNILSKEGMPDIGGITDFPNKNKLAEFIEKNKADIKRLYHFSKEHFRKDTYDLCFVTFLQLDRIQHFLWRYTDPEDCTYPGPNNYRESIKEFYQLFDEIIGWFMESLDNQTALMIISDHGHGRRCTKVLNINEILRRAGYVKSRVGRCKYLDLKYLAEKAKLETLEAVYHLNLEDLMFAITRYIPNRKALKKSTFITNNTTSLASTSVFAGTNPYGGITIHRENMKQTGMDYEAFRLEVIRLLQDFKDERTGKRPFVWLKCREDVDHGPFLDIYPDILFELEESYGVNWALHTKITRVNTTHKKISGGHRYHGFYGIFNSKSITGKGRIVDIASTILNILQTPAGEKS